MKIQYRLAYWEKTKQYVYDFGYVYVYVPLILFHNMKIQYRLVYREKTKQYVHVSLQDKHYSVILSCVTTALHLNVVVVAAAATVSQN